MRALCVYENLDFERGMDPKKALGIGSIEAKLLNRMNLLAKAGGYTSLRDKVAAEDGTIGSWTKIDEDDDVILIQLLKWPGRSMPNSEHPDYRVMYDFKFDPRDSSRIGFITAEVEKFLEGNWP